MTYLDKLNLLHAVLLISRGLRFLVLGWRNQQNKYAAHGQTTDPKYTYQGSFCDVRKAEVAV